MSQQVESEKSSASPEALLIDGGRRIGWRIPLANQYQGRELLKPSGPAFYHYRLCFAFGHPSAIAISDGATDD